MGEVTVCTIAAALGGVDPGTKLLLLHNSVVKRAASALGASFTESAGNVRARVNGQLARGKWTSNLKGVFGLFGVDADVTRFLCSLN